MHRTHALVRALSVLALAGSFFSVSGCIERRAAPLQPRVGVSEHQRLGDGGYNHVDLLVVVDDSQSMEREQDTLGARMAPLVTQLVSPPDENGDGRPDWTAPESVRIGVVTTDMSLRGHTEQPYVEAMPRCVEQVGTNRPWQGRDGELVEALAEWRTGDDAAAFGARVGDVVSGVGLRGCPIEQQIESAARGLERLRGMGFPRQDAVLAVLLLTDEEDCSIPEGGADEFYAQFSDEAGNVLCARRGDLLSSVEAIATRLRGDRDDDSFVFAAITGIPEDLSGREPASILDDARMTYVETMLAPRTPPVLTPACREAGAPLTDPGAAPARRVVQLASQFEGSVVHSICSADFTPAISSLVRRIAQAFTGACLVRRPCPDAQGAVQCVVREIYPRGTSCSGRAGRRFETTEGEREVCIVDQAAPGDDRVAHGWFYDESDTSCARISYTAGDQPPVGVDLEIDCFNTVHPGLEPGQCPDALETPVIDGGTGGPVGP